MSGIRPHSPQDSEGPLPAVYPVPPFGGPAAGTASVPGSKSLTNRALLLAAAAGTPVTLTGALFSRDTALMSECLRRLGLGVREDTPAGAISVDGSGAGPAQGRSVVLNVGNAGTVARFLTAFLAALPGGRYTLDGDPAMRRRPMEGLLEALAEQGCGFVFHGQPGCFPFTMAPTGLRGGDLEVDARASGQIVSALLMAGTLARTELRLRLRGATVSEPFIEMTAALLGQWGADVGRADAGWRVAPGPLTAPNGGAVPIEPDATAASYFLALPLAVGGRLQVAGVREPMLQGDVAFAGVLRALGMSVENAPEGLRAAAPDVWAIPPEGRWDFDFEPFSDTFLTLAALAPLLPAPVTLRGLAHTRRQETDRLRAMATELAKLGVGVEEAEDRLTVVPDAAALRAAARRGVEIETYEDHRVAMSFGILGSADLRGDGQPWLALRDPACCAKTFPDFFARLQQIRRNLCR